MIGISRKKDSAAAVLRCLVPVSYTHLDVYKRQGLAGALNGFPSKIISDMGNTESLRCMIPVSYTHLDVYKRQQLVKERARSLYISLGLTGGIALLFALAPGFFFPSYVSSMEMQALQGIPADQLAYSTDSY